MCWSPNHARWINWRMHWGKSVAIRGSWTKAAEGCRTFKRRRRGIFVERHPTIWNKPRRGGMFRQSFASGIESREDVAPSGAWEPCDSDSTNMPPLTGLGSRTTRLRLGLRRQSAAATALSDGAPMFRRLKPDENQWCSSQTRPQKPTTSRTRKAGQETGAPPQCNVAASRQSAGLYRWNFQRAAAYRPLRVKGRGVRF